MGSHSVSTHRGLVHWQGLLLVVSLLPFWNLPTTAEISVVSVFAAQGEDVVLRIRNKPPQVVGVLWYKGLVVDYHNIIAFFITTSNFHLSGPGYNGEQMIDNDGSLLLKNVTVKDAGMYTVVVHLPDSQKTAGFGHLDVFVRDDWLDIGKMFDDIKQCKAGRISDCIL